MPELPEVEDARQALQKALNRAIARVDDADEFVCRPHRPGDIDRVLTGSRLVAAHRLGKTLWCETVTAIGADGPHLGLHLGMGGRVFVTAPGGADDGDGGWSGGDPHVGGMPTGSGQRPSRPEWDRVTIEFCDGGRLRLFDKRRLARFHLEPDLGALGPDAGRIGRTDFRARVGRGSAPIKARLLDQRVLAGVGNLLADQTLWQARLPPSRPAGQLGDAELDALRRELRAATRSAIRNGGVHTGQMIRHRRVGASCPRCGAPMRRGTVGGRTTWWCSAEQAPDDA